MPEQLLEEVVPPAPPEGLDTVLYERDERAARADLRRQIAAMELALARLFGSAFPRKGIDFSVPGMGGPRVLSVDELEKVRDALAARISEVRGDLHDRAVVEEANRGLIEEMTADPASYKWVRVGNRDVGEPGCKNWHATPRWGPLGLLLGWWRVKISSGCPLAEGPRPPETRWRRSDSVASGGGNRTRRTGAERPGPQSGYSAVPGQRAGAPDPLARVPPEYPHLADRPTVPPPRGALSRSRRSSSSSACSC